MTDASLHYGSVQPVRFRPSALEPLERDPDILPRVAFGRPYRQGGAAP